MTADPAAATQQACPTLSEQHANMIAESGISAEVAAARGYRTVTTKTELERLGFAPSQRLPPALLIPVHGVTGELATHQIRPDRPRIRDGKAIKYETPRGSRMALDVPPSAHPLLGDPAQPLFITEGVRKADAAVSAGLCCLALLGVWNWRGINDDGGLTALAEWEAVALKNKDGGRLVYIAFDSDVMTKPEVAMALGRLRAFLKSRGAHVRLIYLPSGPGGVKVGLDDYLAAGHTVDDLLALATDQLREPPPEPNAPAEFPYRITEHGSIEWQRQTRDGAVWTPLCNFAATITADAAHDDGAETQRVYAMAGAVMGRARVQFSVPAAHFPALNWVSKELGAGAIIYPGQSTRDHLRVAIQQLSGDIPERRVYSHTGWRLLDGGWAYLHADGAIGTNGPVAGVETALSGPLVGYRLPDPPTGAERVAAIRASLGVLAVAPDSISVPLLAAVYRAVLGRVDFNLHLAGGSGVFKTAIAALAQQHHGAGLDARHLPANWSSTANSLEGLAFHAADAVLVVDDFAPAGSAVQVAQLHAAADRLMRGQGNGSGRGRMNADGTLRPAKPPRGLILSTGEDVPKGQSLRARMLIVDVPPGVVDLPALSHCQGDADGGLYAAALAGFVQWLAPSFAERQVALKARVTALRDQTAGAHRRTPAMVAELTAGWELFLAYALDCDAITETERAELWERGWAALGAAAAAQAAHQSASEPVARFLELLGAALGSGAAHVAAPDGGHPLNPRAWGWRDAGFNEFRPLGPRIGWVEGDDIYLQPDAAYDAAQRLASGDGLTIGVKSLAKRLHERGLLRATEASRATLTVRKVIAGKRLAVLHLPADRLLSAESDQPDHSAEPEVNAESDEAAGGQVSWSVIGPREGKPDQKTCPIDTAAESGDCAAGQFGQVGQVSASQQAGGGLEHAAGVTADAAGRAALLTVAAERGYPETRLDARKVMAGETNWGMFVRYAAPADLLRAVDALKAVTA